MNFFVILMITFAAFASAIPHAGRGHAHAHQLAHGIKHHVQVAHAGSIAGRSVSYDGSCGSWSGMTCAEGFCCGPNGWCGNASEHCGVGCQAGFGDCGSGSSSSSYVEPEPSMVGTQSIVAAPGSTTSTAVMLPPITSSSSSTSAASTSSASMAISLANKGSDDDGHRPDRPSYGAPHSTMITKTIPAMPSSQTEQSTAPENPPSAYPTLSAEPTTAESSPPVSIASSASPTDASSAPSSYGSAAPAPTSGGSGGSQDGSYVRTYKGDGSTNEGWPSQSEWLSFDSMWEANQKILKSSCSSAFSQIDNSDQELDDIKSSVEDISSSTGVDKTFMLAIMLQESNGCVRVQTTSYSHANPGLFQSHEGSGSCNDGSNVQTPCPKTQIHQMIEDGVVGTAAGDGLKQLLDAATGDGAQKFYQAARMYNSGSIDPSGNLGLGVATHCYSSDIANRLTGWSAGVSKCDAGTVGA